MISDAPDILGEPTYMEKADGIQMELVCIVHASPAATWLAHRYDAAVCMRAHCAVHLVQQWL